MDAVKFLKERKRMCRFCKACKGCRISEISDATGCINTDYESQVKIVEEWSKEHPVKTRMSEFLKEYPNADLTARGVPNIHPCDLDERLATSEHCHNTSCVECCKKYWLEEIE